MPRSRGDYMVIFENKKGFRTYSSFENKEGLEEWKKDMNGSHDIIISEGIMTCEEARKICEETNLSPANQLSMMFSLFSHNFLER